MISKAVVKTDEEDLGHLAVISLITAEFAQLQELKKNGQGTRPLDA